LPQTITAMGFQIRCTVLGSDIKNMNALCGASRVNSKSGCFHPGELVFGGEQ
jgi:hypothetical protein